MDRVATLDENFCALLAEFMAGDPMRQSVLWTDLSRREISRRLGAMGTPASRHVVRKLLEKRGLGQRKACKKKPMGAHPDRNAQFENIGPNQSGISGQGRAREHLTNRLGLEICIAHCPPYCFPNTTRSSADCLPM